MIACTMQHDKVEESLHSLVEAADETEFTTVGQQTAKELNIRRDVIETCQTKVEHSNTSQKGVTHLAVITCENVPELTIFLNVLHGKTIDIVGYFTGQTSMNGRMP